VTVNPFADSTAREMLDVAAERWGERPAMLFGDARVTFAEFRERVATLAGGLAALGIELGDKLAIWLPNRPAWFVAQYACATLGAVVVALNPRYRAHELTYIVQAFVVGVPDPKLNEAPVAYVIAVEGSRLTEDELRTFCRGKIASYKIPIAVRLVKDVPRTPGPHGDKVQRAVLREQAIKEMRR